MKSEIANVAASMGALEAQNDNKMPVYGTQVMVQSEDEKQMRKQVRKEEKRINKLINKQGFFPKSMYFWPFKTIK